MPGGCDWHFLPGYRLVEFESSLLPCPARYTTTTMAQISMLNCSVPPSAQMSSNKKNLFGALLRVFKQGAFIPISRRAVIPPLIRAVGCGCNDRSHPFQWDLEAAVRNLLHRRVGHCDNESDDFQKKMPGSLTSRASESMRRICDRVPSGALAPCSRFAVSHPAVYSFFNSKSN